MLHRTRLLIAIRVLLLVNLVLLQQLIPAISLTGLGNETLSAQAPEIAIKGFKNLDSVNYNANLATNNCGTHNNTGIVGWDWDLTKSSEEPVKYTYKLTTAPSGVSKTSATTTDTHYIQGLPKSGTYIIEVYATDASGNKGPSRYCSVIKDVTPSVQDTVRPTVNLIFPNPIGETGKSFKAVFSENVKSDEATNPANYFLHNWPTAASSDSGNLVGKATITYNPSTYTATISFPRIGWWIAPEQQWGVQNIHDLAGNLLVTSPYAEFSTSLKAPVTKADGMDGNWHNTDVTAVFECTDGQGSGCNKTLYKINDGSFTAGNIITLKDNGIFNLSFYSTDLAGNTEATKTSHFPIKIDKISPVVKVPSDQVFETRADNYNYSFEATVSDNLADGLTASCSPSNKNTLYPIGKTTVTCTTKDEAGNIGSAAFTVTVNKNMKPIINTPSNIIVEATATWGAVVNYGEVTATNHDGSVSQANCLPQSGSQFVFNDTIVTCTARDNHDNSIVATSTFIVTVKDTTKPKVSVPAAISLNTNNADGANVTFTVSAVDNIDGSISNVTCTKSSGSLFNVGTTFVTCTATDAHGNSDSAIFSILVTYVAQARTVIAIATATPSATPTPSSISKAQVLGTEGSSETVLVNQSCIKQDNASGIVFIDKNGNNSKNISEQTVADVEVIISAGSTDVKTVKTDASGLWMVSLCAGDYKLKVNASTLPSGTKLAQDNLDLVVKPGSENENNNIALNESANYWWVLILPLIFVVVGSISYVIYKRGQTD